MIPRFANQNDVPGLVRLINAAYRVEDFFINGDRTTQADILARLDAPQAAFLVIDAPHNGNLAGAVYVELRGDLGYFGLLSVDPARQGQGLGRALVNAAQAHCRDAGCRIVEIDVVNLRAELPAFYAKLGFTPVGTAPFPAPGKLQRAAHLVVMTKPLAED